MRSSPRLFVYAILLLAAALGSGVATRAHAHAIVIEAEPKAGTSLPPASFAVMIRFNSRIDAARSTLVILDAKRAAIPLTLDANDLPDRLTARVPALEPGAYRFRWQVLALDGHITRGDVPFTIAPPAAP